MQGYGIGTGLSHELVEASTEECGRLGNDGAASRRQRHDAAAAVCPIHVYLDMAVTGDFTEQSGDGWLGATEFASQRGLGQRSAALDDEEQDGSGVREAQCASEDAVACAVQRADDAVEKDARLDHT